MLSNAIVAVGETIWNACSSVVHKRIRRKHKSDLPISISSVEKKFFESTMLGYILLFNEDATFVLHITRGTARILVIMTIVFNSETSGRDNPVTTDGHLFRIVTGPNFNFVNIVLGETRLHHRVVKILSVLVVVVVTL